MTPPPPPLYILFSNMRVDLSEKACVSFELLLNLALEAKAENGYHTKGVNHTLRAKNPRMKALYGQTSLPLTRC